MLVKINNSRLFNTNPSVRFAAQYAVPETLWNELWKRYKLLGYTPDEMTEYFEIKTKRQIRKRQVLRWIFLTDIYYVVKPARDMGAKVVNTDLFGDNEQKVIYEVIRHMKSGSTKNSNMMV